jgi:hypothetical protein
MDRKDFRQIDERYIAGKAFDGASGDSVVDGVYNPIEELNYVVEQDQKVSKDNTSGTVQRESSFFWLIIIVNFAVLAILPILIKAIP